MESAMLTWIGIRCGISSGSIYMWQYLGYYSGGNSERASIGGGQGGLLVSNDSSWGTCSKARLGDYKEGGIE